MKPAACFLPSMPKAKTASKPASALIVLQDATTLTLPKQGLTRFQARTVDAVEMIARSEQSNVTRRIMVGIALHVVKGNLKHGEFMPWLKANFTGGGYTQCTYMMRVAKAFAGSAALEAKDLSLLSLDKKTLSLTDKAKAPNKLIGAAREWTGDASWGELLAREGIHDEPKLGGARTAIAGPAATPSEEQLYLQYRDEIGGILLRAEELFIKENRLQHLAGHPEEIAGTVSALRSLADKVEAAAKPLIRPKA